MKSFKLTAITIHYEVREDGKPPVNEERKFNSGDTVMPSSIHQAMQTVSWWLRNVLGYEANG